MKQQVLLGQIVNVLEELYPLSYALDWDHPGLIVGNRNWEVSKVYCTVDVTREVVHDAVQQGANLIVSHHPLFFRAVHGVSADSFRGSIVETLIEHHCGLWVGHTNADAAWRGVSHALATRLQLQDLQPLVLLPHNDDERIGIGRVGVLPESITLRSFAEQVNNALDTTVTGVNVAGDPEQLIKRVAVLGGAGDSEFDAAFQHNVDVYVTSDLRHHPVLDARQQLLCDYSHPAPAIINTAHSASERCWFDYAVPDIAQALANTYQVEIPIICSRINTDPWDFRIA